jgi:hypothetical protein
LIGCGVELVMRLRKRILEKRNLRIWTKRIELCEVLLPTSSEVSAAFFALLRDYPSIVAEIDLIYREKRPW